MANPIRPEDLPAVPSLAGNHALIVDTGSGVFKTTPDEIVQAGGAATSAALAATSGSSLIGYLSPGTGAVSRTAQDKLRDFVSVYDYGAKGDGATDDYDAIIAALSAVSRPPGRGGTLWFPAGNFVFSQTIVIPSRVRIVGMGPRTTLFSPSHNGTAFRFDSVTNAGISHARIGLGNGAAARCIEMLATNPDVGCRDNRLHDLELVGSGVSGQIGIYVEPSASYVVENIATDFLCSEIDRGIVDLGSEGNTFAHFTIDGFAYGTAKAALDLSTNANVYDGRITRGNVAGCTAYKQAGNRNRAGIRADIGPVLGPSSYALDLSGSENKVFLERPELSTQLGTVAVGNLVIDDATFMGQRVSNRGALPTSANFTLGAGFGSTATVSNIKGSDQCVRFTITAGGSGIAANPTIAYSFQDGTWPLNSGICCPQRDGGNDNTTIGFQSSAATSTGWSTVFLGTPQSGYQYDIIVRMA